MPNNKTNKKPKQKNKSTTHTVTQGNFEREKKTTTTVKVKLRCCCSIPIFRELVEQAGQLISYTKTKSAQVELLLKKAPAKS